MTLTARGFEMDTAQNVECFGSDSYRKPVFCGALRVLIVDDEKAILAALVQHISLLDENIVVSCATSAEEAMPMLTRSHVDLLITDLRLPNMDGLELIKVSREVSPEIRTILITAYGSEEVQRSAVAEGCAGYLEKPFSIDSLVDVIKSSAKLTEFRESEKHKLDSYFDGELLSTHPTRKIDLPNRLSNPKGEQSLEFLKVMRFREKEQPKRRFKDFSEEELTLQPEYQNTSLTTIQVNDFSVEDLTLQPEVVVEGDEEEVEQVRQEKEKKLRDLVNKGIYNFRNRQLLLAEKCWTSALDIDGDCEQAQMNLAVLRKVKTKDEVN